MTARRRIALVADTHGALDARVAQVAVGCEVVVHAGDIGGDSILAALGATGARVIAVAGNADTPRHWPEGDRARLDGLTGEATVDLPGGRLVVVHGHQWPARNRHARLRRLHRDAAAVVVGHSHRRVIDDAQRPWVLNPGAAGRSRTYGGPGCLVLEAGPRRWRVTIHAFERQR